MRKIPYYSIILGVVIGLMLVGCGGGSGGSHTTAYVENEAQSLTSLGEFPVGISDYTPSTITIKNATGEALATTEVVSTTELEQVANNTWKLVVTGTFTAPEMSGKKLEIAGLYVNWEPLTDNGTDAVHLPTSDAAGTFTKTLYITSTDVANIYFPITVAVVDEKHYVVGERAVVVLQRATATSTVTDAVKIYGDQDFVLNTLNMALASIDGQNLAPYIPRTQWTIPETVQNETDPHVTFLDLSPRDVMLQGIKVTGYTVESDGAGGYKIHTDMTVRNLVIEYNNNSSLFNLTHPKGKNYINMRTKNLGINNGFVLWLKKESDGYQAYLTTDANVSFAAGSTGDLDTPFFSVISSVIDVILDFLQDAFKITVANPIHINLAQPVLAALIKEIASNDPQQLTPTYPITALTMDNTSIALSLSTALTSRKTYTTPDNHGTAPTMDLSGTNSTIALKDDLINQALAAYLAGQTGDISIDDLDAYIQNLIDNLGYGDLELGIWNWLKDADTGKYPPLNIHFAINTPPIFIPDATGATLGTLYLRDLRVEIWEIEDPCNNLLAAISIDMNMRMQWKSGKLTLSLINNTIQYSLLFNKLYPLYLPSEIKQLPTAVANMLNDIFEKLGIVGYTIKDIISTGGYLAIHGDLGTYTTPSTVVSVAPYAQNAWNNPAYLATLVTSWENDYPEAYRDITSSDLNAVAGADTIAYSADDTSLTWDDGMAFMFAAEDYHPDDQDHNFVITHISFSPEIDFTGSIATSLDYYEEFALLGVIHESQLAAAYTSVTTGSASAPSIAPKPAYAIAREVEFNDSDLTTTIQPTEGIATGTVDQDLPFCSTVGIGLRIRKSPVFQQAIALNALASNIKVTMVDLKLKGLTF